MEEMNSVQIEKTILQQLEKKGIESKLIPRFIRDLTQSLHVDPSMTLPQINNRLQSLGWDNIEIDYHTLELIKACIENHGSNGRRR